MKSRFAELPLRDEIPLSHHLLAALVSLVAAPLAWYFAAFAGAVLDQSLVASGGLLLIAGAIVALAGLICRRVTLRASWVVGYQWFGSLFVLGSAAWGVVAA